MKRSSVYVVIVGLFVFSARTAAVAKEAKESAAPSSSVAPVAATPSEFQWNEHRKLSWEDFKGEVNAASEESAAATHCGMGFKTVTGNDGKPQIVVYNKFYTSRSWVRSDARMASILDHEQGHFDLCEVYTRKLRQQLAGFNFETPDVKQVLVGIYSDVNKEYENAQQSYEEETAHGTNLPAQKRWQQSIAMKLQ